MGLCVLGHELVDGVCYICTTEGRCSATFRSDKGIGVVSGAIANRTISGVFENSHYDLALVSVTKDGVELTICPNCKQRVIRNSIGFCSTECKWHYENN